MENELLINNNNDNDEEIDINNFLLNMNPCFKIFSKTILTHINNKYRNPSEERILESINNVKNEVTELFSNRMNNFDNKMNNFDNKINNFENEIKNIKKSIKFNNKQLKNISFKIEFLENNSNSNNLFLHYLKLNKILISIKQLKFIAQELSNELNIKITRNTIRKNSNLLIWYEENYIKILPIFLNNFEHYKLMENYPK